MLRLHVGCGRERLEGWVNVDVQLFPGVVDFVADAGRGLAVRDLDAVFAEHFLEHLELDAAVAFLVDAHRALRPAAPLRLSTPNLEWVWRTHYRQHAEPEQRRRDALMLNRAFHGWEHRFLWNRALLAEALAACGFVALRWHRHGESERAQLRALERHETYPDTPELPHVLVVEATKGEQQPELLAALRRRVETYLGEDVRSVPGSLARRSHG